MTAVAPPINLNINRWNGANGATNGVSNMSADVERMLMPRKTASRSNSWSSLNSLASNSSTLSTSAHLDRISPSAVSGGHTMHTVPRPIIALSRKIKAPEFTLDGGYRLSKVASTISDDRTNQVSNRRRQLIALDDRRPKVNHSYAQSRTGLEQAIPPPLANAESVSLRTAYPNQPKVVAAAERYLPNPDFDSADESMEDVVDMDERLVNEIMEGREIPARVNPFSALEALAAQDRR